MRISLPIILLLLLATPTWCQSDTGVGSIAAANVMAFGAKADGKTDDTAAFQKALDSAKGKGGIVLAPAGKYLIAGNLEVHRGITLRGVWEAPHHSTIDQGTLLLATGSEGKNIAKPFIHLNQDSAAKGLTILYPNQKVDSPVVYPWTIEGEAMHCSVIDVTLVNPYRGIKMVGELHYIKNVFGCPLVNGIAIDNCTDVGRIEDVHFNPHYWIRTGHPSWPADYDAKKFFKYLSENLIAFRIGKTDWEYMSNCFCIFAKIGFHFIQTPGGAPNAVLTQCGSDIGETAIQVDACQGHAGLAFSNCQIMARVVIGPDNHGMVKFSNCGFWPAGETDNQVLMEGHEAISFSNCHFWDWGQKDRNAPCILMKSGALILTGCEFVAAKPQIELGEDVKSAVITGNRFRNEIKITNKTKGDVQIGFNTKQ